MTKFEYTTFKEKLKTRFYWCYSTQEKQYLSEKGYRYLFRCTHYKTGKFFWVYDISDELMEDVKNWKSQYLEKASEAVIE